MSVIPLTSFDYLLITFVAFVLIYFWFFRIRRLIDGYLDVMYELLQCQSAKRHRLFPLYMKEELVGSYQGREVVCGIRYRNRGFELMALPFIKIKLKSVIRYNYQRLPYFAQIERGWLVLHITKQLPWGMFDKEYLKLFTKESLVITLTRLLAVAEDVERGKTLQEVFK